MRLSLLLPVALAAVVSHGFAQSQPPPAPNAIRIGDFAKIDADGRTAVLDPETGISFELPVGWLLANGFRWGAHETTLTLIDTQTHIGFTMYYQCPIETAPPANLEVALYAGMEGKVRQRQDREGLKTYHLRAGSQRFSSVNGHPALAFVADYTAPGGRAFSEYMTRVLSTASKAEFFATLPAGLNPGAFLNGFDAVVQSLRIP